MCLLRTWLRALFPLPAPTPTPSASKVVHHPETSMRARNVIQGRDRPKQRTLLTFKPSSDLEEHFAVEHCAEKPFGSVPDPTDPTCYFICLGVDNRGIRKCCQLPGSCYVPPPNPFAPGYCSDCSSGPSNRESPPPTGTLYAVGPFCSSFCLDFACVRTQHVPLVCGFLHELHEFMSWFFRVAVSFHVPK
jgi:hypothetical protein